MNIKSSPTQNVRELLDGVFKLIVKLCEYGHCW